MLSLSIAYNLFGVAGRRSCFSFDDALTIGRMVKSKQDGLFSYVGFAGVLYDKKSLPDSIKNDSLFDKSADIRDWVVGNHIQQQFQYLLGQDTNIPKDYYPYISESGGNSSMFAALNILLPFNPYTNIAIIRFINAGFLAIALLLFVGWSYRNFGSLSAIVVFTLIFLSPWFVYLGSSLRWCVWCYYFPFLVMLLMLERRAKYPEQITENKIFVYLFVAVFVKHLLFGFEFVSVILLAIYPPIIYYYWIEKRSFSSFIMFSFKAGIVALIAVALESLILLIQLAILKGKGILFGLSYLFNAYERRSISGVSDGQGLVADIIRVLDVYLHGDAFGRDTWESPKVLISYFIVIFVIVLFVFFINFIIKKSDDAQKRKMSALFICTASSILCPFSWFIIFMEHSLGHQHRAYIVWYVPFMLFCFLITGVFVSKIVDLCKNRLSKSNTL